MKIKKIIFLITIFFVFISCKNKNLIHPLKFVRISIPKTEVNDSLDLVISQTVITQGLYEEIMKTNPSVMKDEQLPVTNISYIDACIFTNKLNERFGFEKTYQIEKDGENLTAINITDKNGFRLLTDNEYKQIYNYMYLYNSENRILNYRDNLVNGWHGSRIHKVAHVIPDKLGLFDFASNAREYTSVSYKDFNIQKYGVASVEEVKENSNQNAYQEYKDYFSPIEDITSFRICISTDSNLTKLNILSESDIKQIKDNWIKNALNNYEKELEMVHCEEYSYETKGTDSDENKNIKVFVPEVNVAKCEISKSLYDLIINCKIDDGIDKKELRYNNYTITELFQPNTLLATNGSKNNFDVITAIEFCNKLSELKGLTPCYKKIDNVNYDKYVCDFEANGYRLPSQSECISFYSQHNENPDINFNSEHWNLTFEKNTDKLYTTDMYAPCNQLGYNYLIYRYAGPNKKPISNVNDNYVSQYQEKSSPNFCLRVYQTANPKQIKEYSIKQTEECCKKTNEYYKSQMKLIEIEGGLKKLSYLYDDEIELCDYEITESKITTFLYRTAMGKFEYETENYDELKTDYKDIVEFCNRISSFLNFEPCYFQPDPIKNPDNYVCDYSKNGFRLPTTAEIIYAIEEYSIKTSSITNNIYTGDELIAYENSFPKGIDYLNNAWNYRTLIGCNYNDEIYHKKETYNNFVLCRTTNTDLMKELLNKNKEETKKLYEKVDKALGMVPIAGKKYTMKYYDSNKNENISQTKRLSDFLMMNSKMTNKLYNNFSYSTYNSYENTNQFVNIDFIESLVLCNTLSRIANLEPCYKIEGKYEPDSYEEFEDWKSKYVMDYNHKTGSFISIDFNENSNGYRIPYEIEWDYAATCGEENPDLRKLEKEFIYDYDKMTEAEPNAFGMKLMNTSYPEWCFDKSSNMIVTLESKGYMIENTAESETRVVRYFPGKDSITYTYQDYWRNFRDIEYEKRNIRPYSNCNYLRLTRNN